MFAAPYPGVAKPYFGKNSQKRGIRTTIRNRQTYENVIGTVLGVFDCPIEVAPFVEDASVGQFELRLIQSTTRVPRPQLIVGKGALRIFVEGFRINMGGRGILIVVDFLAVLAVIALLAVESEKAFLDDRILTVPECGSEADAALPVADPKQSVLSPAIGPKVGMFEGKVIPGFALCGIVFSDCAPLAFRQVGSPTFPVFVSFLFFLQSLGFALSNHRRDPRGGALVGKPSKRFKEKRNKLSSL